MQKLLLLFALLISLEAPAQLGYIMLKKRGLKKVYVINEGDVIHFKMRNGDHLRGVIGLVQGDSFYVDLNPFPVQDIKTVYLREKSRAMVNDALYTAGGLVLTSAAMSLTKVTTISESVIGGSTIGAGQYLLRNLSNLKRRKYELGRKFRPQAMDLRFRRGF